MSGRGRTQLGVIQHERPRLRPRPYERSAIRRRGGDILDRNELAARISLALQPVGVDEQRVAVVRARTQVGERGRHVASVHRKRHVYTRPMPRFTCLVACLPLLSLACRSDETPSDGDSTTGPNTLTLTGDGDGDPSGDGDGSPGDGDGSTGDGDGDGDGNPGDGDGDPTGGPKFDLAPPPDKAGTGCDGCSSDYLSVLDCGGNVIEECQNGTACDPAELTCLPACDVSETHKFSIGCEYYAVRMHSLAADNYCYAAFVSNPWNVPAFIEVEYAGMPLAVETFAWHPNGVGPNLNYQPYDANVGIMPGEMVILFLTGGTGASPQCPHPSAVPNAVMSNTGIGEAFRILSDVPVVAYQMNPYGGGSVAVTGASLLIPTSAWDTDYISVNAYSYDLAPPSMNIIAREDDTEITMYPVAAVQAGGGLPAGAAMQPYVFNLDAGQQAQFSQTTELTGSAVIADKPIGLLAGHACLRIPTNVAYCDHAEEMIPPVGALGSSYAGVMHQPRSGEPSIWRMVGAVDGTQLSWDPDVGGPATLDAGQIVEFITGTPFLVESQNSDHPFLLMNYMSGSQWNQLNNQGGYGDPEFAISVPIDQFLGRYVFFTDPTYPETALTVIRKRHFGSFRDVELDCLGVLQDWTPLGGDIEWTRVQLITGDFAPVNGCTTGSHEIHSDGPFGLWVWGWGTPQTGTFTANVSYGYPGGMNVATINDVNIDPQN